MEQLNQQIAAHPDDGPLYLRRATAYRNRQHWDEAARDLERAERLAVHPLELAMAWGRLHLEAGRPAAAVGALDRALDEDPSHLVARRLRARAAFESGDFDRAVDDYVQVLESAQSPTPDLVLDAASALAASGQLERAVEEIDRAVARFGSLTSLEQAAITYLSRLGRLDAALERTHRLPDKTRFAERWWLTRGNILEQAGRAGEAREAYGRARSLLESRTAGRPRSQTIEDVRERLDQALERLGEARAQE